MNDALVGTVISDRFEVEALIAEGGMATIYRARSTDGDAPVAVKVLHRSGAGERAAKRFSREVQVASTLEHPNILPLLASGEHDGHPFYVMPFVEGQTLRDRIHRLGALSCAEALQLAIEIADALDHAHRAGITHRDIKPENILLQNGHAVVADFGLASPPPDPGSAVGLTLPGTRLGTLHYMSPEQAAGQPVDHRSDVYSLGCVLYEMLTGQAPLVGPNDLITLSRRRSERPLPVGAFRNGVGPRLERTVQKTLEVQPGRRFRSAAALRAALKKALREARGAAGIGQPGERMARVLAVLALLSVAGFGAWQIESGKYSTGSAGSTTVLTILPFATTGTAAATSPEDAAIAARLERDLLDALTGVRRLRVSAAPAARSSAAAGGSGSAQVTLDGGLSRSGRTLRVQLRLTRDGSGQPFWEQTFSGGPADLDAMVATMSEAIARAIESVSENATPP